MSSPGPGDAGRRRRDARRPGIRRLTTPPRRGEDSPVKRVLIHVVLILSALIAVFPVIRVFGTALRPGNNLLNPTPGHHPARAPRWTPSTTCCSRPACPTGCSTAWWSRLGTALVGLILAATSAYAFSRYKFRARSLGLTFLFATQLIPGIMLLVPIYLLAVQLQLIGTYQGLVIAYAVTAVPFSIWILKGYYDTVPMDLEEAALIDGCSEFQAFRKILLPLSLPALAIVFLFNFLAAWGEYFTARVIIGSSESLLTWPLGIQRFQAAVPDAVGGPVGLGDHRVACPSSSCSCTSRSTSSRASPWEASRGEVRGVLVGGSAASPMLAGVAGRGARRPTPSTAVSRARARARGRRQRSARPTCSTTAASDLYRSPAGRRACRERGRAAAARGSRRPVLGRGPRHGHASRATRVRCPWTRVATDPDAGEHGVDYWAGHAPDARRRPPCWTTRSRPRTASRVRYLSDDAALDGGTGHHPAPGADRGPAGS